MCYVFSPSSFLFVFPLRVSDETDRPTTHSGTMRRKKNKTKRQTQTTSNIDTRSTRSTSLPHPTRIVFDNGGRRKWLLDGSAPANSEAADNQPNQQATASALCMDTYDCLFIFCLSFSFLCVCVCVFVSFRQQSSLPELSSR